MRAYKKIKEKILVLLLTLGVCSSVFANPGDSCEEPIVLTPEYRENITSACTRWYIANTFDLPLAIGFYPSNGNSPAPKLYLDFSCTPGDYDDPILCSLFCIENSVHIAMPYEQTPSKSYDEQGNPRYLVEFGEFYRDMLLSQGIDYNVPVYVKVVFSGGGTLTMEPDAFGACMDGPKFMHYGDTVQVKAYDKERHVIVPYVQWQYDSIRYVWQGEKECVLAVGNKCSFDPTDELDGTIIDGGVIQPGGEFKVSSTLLMKYVMDQKNFPNDAGMYYAKFYSEAPGVMKVEKIPAPAPGDGATLLKYGVPAKVYSNDTETLYAIPSSWVKDMQFSTPTDHIFKMYIGSKPDFTLEEAVATYQFDRTTDGHMLSLFAADMESLWTHKAADEHYLYIRFECSDNTTVIPMLWSPSDCMAKVIRIEAAEQFEVTAKSSTVYGLYYEDWRGGDMTVAWTSGQAACLFYIADTCEVPNSEIEPVFYANKAPKKGSVVCLQDTVDSWAPYVDPDGYLYIRFYSTAKGNITVTTSAPEEQDSPCSTYDSLLTVWAWDSYTWRGNTYTTSGKYTEDVIDQETGCTDSTFVLNLKIQTTTYDTYSETGCDSVVYRGKKYTESGEYADTLVTSGTTRTITILTLTVNHSSYKDTTVASCGAYEWRGTTYTESGVYRDTIPNKAGCDSVMTLYLTVGQSYNKTLEDIKVCDSYVWGDTVITKSGTYTRTFKSVHGCDSIVTQTITIGQSYLNMVDEISAYDSYTWIDGKTYTSSIYGPVMELYTVDGCDSLIILNLTIRHLEKDTFYPTICSSELPYVWYGEHLNEGGMYSTDTLPGVGTTTDTVHTLVLTVNPVYAVDTVAEACDAFIWRGTTYTESGDYPYYAQTKAGCDSTVTLHLTIHQRKEMAPEVVKACDSYEWHGVTYTKSGIYKDTLATAHQCDSVCVLDLTVGYTTYGEWTEEAYDSYTSPRGITYTESGDYTEKEVNATDCDSIITLHLTIHTTIRTDIIESGCDSIIIEGVKYTESIARIDTIVAPNGDREIKTLNLTIGHTTYGEWTEEACEIYISPRGITYTESGDYIEKEINATGCDSVITLHLTLYEECAVYDTVYYCRGFNTPHDERISDGYIRCYRPYVFESPSTWDYMDGVILSGEPNRTLIDFNRAEANLRDHYTDALTPVERIAWSVRHEENGPYVPVVVEAGPQWIEAGKLAVQIHFRCGEIYNTEFPTGLNQTDAAAQTPIKRMENGQLIIIRGDAVYSPMGQKIK